MIIDSSAIVSVIVQESGYEPLLDRLSGDEPVRVGAATLVETGMVLVARIGLPGKSLLARLLTEVEIETIQIGPTHWPVAVDAFIRYGKGRHPAALNFGDCLTYAVAVVSGEPLLCGGEDFPQTDIALVR